MKISLNKILIVFLLSISITGIIIFFIKGNNIIFQNRTKNKTLYPSVFNNNGNIQEFEKELDSDGIPITTKGYINKTAYHPSYICRYGLYLATKYYYQKNPTDYQKIKNIVDWIEKNKKDNKNFITWELYENDSPEIKTPQTSALTNIWCAGTLLQASNILKKPTLEKDAKLALNYIFVPVENGGGLSKWDDGDIWFEEVPATKIPSHILSSFIYITEILDMFQNYYHTNQYTKYYNLAISSLKNKVYLYDLDYGSIYDQFTKGNNLGMGYHRIQYQQLYWIYLRTKDEYFYNLSQKWFALQMQSNYEILTNYEEKPKNKNQTLTSVNNSVYWTDSYSFEIPFEILLNLKTNRKIKTINIYSVNEIQLVNILNFYFLQENEYKIIDSQNIRIEQKGYNKTPNNKTTYVYVVYLDLPIETSSIKIVSKPSIYLNTILLREIGINKDMKQEFDDTMNKFSLMKEIAKIYEEN